MPQACDAKGSIQACDPITTYLVLRWFFVKWFESTYVQLHRLDSDQ